MVAKDEVVFHVDDIVFVITVVAAEVVENFDFTFALLVETLFVADDLECHSALVLVIIPGVGQKNIPIFIRRIILHQ